MTKQEQALKNLMQDVHKELLVRRGLGMDVPAKALRMAQDKDEMKEFLDKSVDDCAHMLCEFARY